MSGPPTSAVHEANRGRNTSKALAVSRQDAANLLGISLDAFEEHVQPHVRVCRVGRRLIVPVTELQRWMDLHSAVYGAIK
jgi:hypothetical protein